MGLTHPKSANKNNKDADPFTLFLSDSSVKPSTDNIPTNRESTSNLLNTKDSFKKVNFVVPTTALDTPTYGIDENKDNENEDDSSSEGDQPAPLLGRGTVTRSTSILTSSRDLYKHGKLSRSNSSRN